VIWLLEKAGWAYLVHWPGPARLAFPAHRAQAMTDTAATTTPSRVPTLKGPLVKIEKSTIVAILRERNLDARADWVERTLPTIIDSSQNTGLLATLNINPASLANQRP
jgi:hypothetical protein